MYSSTISLTSALDGLGGKRHAPAALPPGKSRYPMYRKLGGNQGRYGRVRKISSLTWIRSPDRPTRSELLYSLRYPRPLWQLYMQKQIRTYCWITFCLSPSWWSPKYRTAHEKPARRLVDQRGRRSRTLYRKLNKCKCEVLNWLEKVLKIISLYVNALLCTLRHIVIHAM